MVVDASCCHEYATNLLCGCEQVLLCVAFGTRVGEPLDANLVGVPTPKALRASAEQLEAAGATDLAADRRERAADLEALARRRDRRIVMTPELAEKFRRVPIRWR